MNTAYWGPEIKVGVPQPALNTDMDAHTNVRVADLSTQRTTTKAMPVVFIQNRDHQGRRSRSRSPTSIRCSPPLGLAAADPDEARLDEGHGEALADGGARQGRGARRSVRRRRRPASGIARRAALRRLLKARQLVGVRGAGIAFDGLYYVKSVTQHAQARRVQAELRAHAQRARSPRLPRGCPHERLQQALRQVPRHGHQQHRSDADGRLQVQVPDVLGAVLSSWAMPCCPVRPASRWAVWSIPQIGAGVWVEFEQGDADYPIWVAAAGTDRPPTCRRSPCPAPPTVDGVHADDRGTGTFQMSDLPGPAGGILLKTATGAHDHGQRRRASRSRNGKGATIVLTGPDGHDQRRRADDHVTGEAS